MSKAILVFDMPSSCIGCPAHFYDEGCKKPFWCDACRREIVTDDVETCKPSWCPLKECPKKVEECPNHTEWQDGFRQGYNACIDEILGGGELLMAKIEANKRNQKRGNRQ